MKPKTNAEIAAALRGFYGSQVIALNGMIDQVPEPMKAQLITMRAEINGLLEKLPLTDAVPAASEANWAMECLAGAFARVQEWTGRLNTMVTEMGAKVNGIPQAVTNGIAAEIEAGNLVKKENVETLVKTAEKNAIKATRDTFAVGHKRVTMLMGENLPLPGTDLLLGEEAAFNAAHATAKTRKGKLEELGIELNGETADLNSLLFGDESAFNSQVKLFGTVLNGTTRTQKRPPADPLKAGGGGGNDDGGFACA